MRFRTSIAVLAIAAILLAGLVVASPIVICEVLVALIVFVVARPFTRVVVHCDDQPVALLSLVSFRAPPRAAFA
jgi:uncharacterized membrane protein